MRPPFPGMDPWLEHPALWPDVHNRLIAAIADAMAPRIAPRYYIGTEQRVYLATFDDTKPIGRPDLGVVPARGVEGPFEAAPESAAVGVLDVELPIEDEVEEWFLEVRDVGSHEVVTVIEVLSPTNKAPGAGRKKYEAKRRAVTRTRTNLVEIDLLRAGRRMPVVSRRSAWGDYRILVARGRGRPAGQLYCFGIRQPIPAVTLPLLHGDDEPPIDLGAILHDLYDRARFDLRLDYAKSPVPALNDEDGAWARQVVGSAAP